MNNNNFWKAKKSDFYLIQREKYFLFAFWIFRYCTNKKELNKELMERFKNKKLPFTYQLRRSQRLKNIKVKQ